MEMISYSRFFELLSNLLAQTSGTEHKRLMRFGIREFKKRSDAGDALALIECWTLCHNSDRAVPSWVLERFGSVLRKYVEDRGRKPIDSYLGLAGARGRANAWKARELAERDEILMQQIFYRTQAGLSVQKACEETAHSFFHQLPTTPRLALHATTLRPRKTEIEFADTLRAKYYKDGWNKFWKSAALHPSIRKRINIFISKHRNAPNSDASPAS